MNQHPSGPAGEDDDPARDAHLRAALRHAPDRDARPPAELSRRILDAAQAAALSSAKTTARPATGSWARVRARLASGIEGLRHPGATAAFASLMLATVIGVMWRDGPPPETEPVHDAAAPAAPSTESPASQAPTVAPAAEAREASAAAPARSAAAAAAHRDDEARREAVTPRPRTAAPTPSTAPAAKATAEAASPPPPASPPAPSVAAPAPAPTAATAPSDRARATAQNQAAAPAGGAAAESGAADERRPSRAAPEDDPLAAPIAALRGSSGGEAPARLARRAEADAAAPSSAAAVLPSALAWFGDAQALTRGQWRPVAAAAVAVMPAAWTEALSADGRALGRVAILDGALWWQPAGEDGRTWRAPLPAGSAAQRLGEALASGALDRPPSRP